MVTAEQTASNRFRFLWLLLVFIFGGAIVGETVALSIVVSVAGSAALSKLYLINGILLFGLPVLFFRNIDKFRRDKQLSAQLLIVCLLLFLYLIASRLYGKQVNVISDILLLVIYPLSYLSKTVLFLTFWTLANDFFISGEAKREFPIIAAWGFVGGLLGSLVAWMLVKVINVEMLLILWIVLYMMAYVLITVIRRRYRIRLLRTERPAISRQKLRTQIEDVLDIRLVREIAIIYFLVFIGIFAFDYLFWKQCHLWFPTSNSMVSFQFSFYIMHAMATILGLWFITPIFVSRWGVARVLFSLPAVLLVASMTLLAALLGKMQTQLFFAAVVFFQFLRYVVFENGFSPVYQMFFSVIPEERRGRVKTFLDGIVKPCAILSSGLFLLAFGRYLTGIILLAGCAAAFLIYMVYLIRRTYVVELVSDKQGHELKIDEIREMDSRKTDKILSLVQRLADTPDDALQSQAVRILSGQEREDFFERLQEMYDKNDAPIIRETIARSLGKVYRFKAKGFVERLLRADNPRIRANALYSINEMNCHWKWQLKDIVKTMLFENNLRVQIEAARFLWLSEDQHERENVLAFRSHLLDSSSGNKRSAGLYLTAVLRDEHWEDVLLSNLNASSMQVFLKSVETIMQYAERAAQIKALGMIERLPREYVTAAGKIMQQQGQVVASMLMAFVPEMKTRRMMFEVIRALRVIKCGGQGASLVLDGATEKAVLRWIFRELSSAYRDSFVWWRYLYGSGNDGYYSSRFLLEDALKERLLRISEWALDVIVLLDNEGLLSRSRKDFNIRDSLHRLSMVEILESLGSHRIGILVIPLLKFTDWEEIAKKGKSVFKFADAIAAADGLHHFVRSENHWICLCAFYCLFQTARFEKFVTGNWNLLLRCSNDSYEYLSSAARYLISKKDTQGAVVVETFSLLETVLFLKKTPLFRNVSGEKLVGLAGITDLKPYGKGTIISREGDVSDHLYIVKNGSLEIVKERDGEKKTVSVISEGETYGEIGLFHQSPRSASAVAGEDCELYIIQRSLLRKIMMREPEIAYNFLEIFSDKLLKSGQENPLPNNGGKHT